MSLVPLTALGTLVFTLVNFFRYLAGRNWNGALTQLIAWAAGLVGIILFAHTSFAAAVTFGGVPLQSMGLASQVFIGLMATSILSTVNEGYKALDATQSANKPQLFPNAMPASSVQPPPHKTP